MVEANPERANMGYIGAIVAVATIGGFLFGYDSGAVNGTQEGLRQAFGLSDAGLGFTVGSLLIGCFIGAFLAGRLADLFGRRNVMMITAVLFTIGALIQGFAHDHTLFVIARLMGGMAVGAASVLSPAYISEVAPASVRGRLTTLQQIMIIIGLTIAFVVNYFLALSAGEFTAPYWAGIEAWRWMYLMQAVPAAIFLVALVFIPESPRYLVSKGRDEKASQVLESLYGGDVARGKLDEIRATYAEDHRPRLSDIKGNGLFGIRPIVWPESCWRCSSNSSESTSSSTTARRCGSWPASAKKRRSSATSSPASFRSRPALSTIMRHRQDRPQAAAPDRLGRHGGVAIRDGLCVQQRHARRHGAAPADYRTWEWSPSSRPTST